ncbi:hypothetical protein GCM10022229_04930 [Luteimonas lutimaris]|uniref:Uncharacterized protein n=1 Tax=Luteimonas lutimaris TaxID=698645 RepID=A0ABP7M4D6_9GAMM
MAAALQLARQRFGREQVTAGAAGGKGDGGIRGRGGHARVRVGKRGIIAAHAAVRRCRAAANGGDALSGAPYGRPACAAIAPAHGGC